MMKFVAVLAAVLVAVSASEYFKQPRYPCAYQVNVKLYEGKKEYGTVLTEVNGRYMKFDLQEKEEDYNVMYLLRPDIGGEGNVTFFMGDGEYCYVEPIEMEDAAYVTESLSNFILMYVDGKNWDHKKSETWRDKKCDHYYDDDDDESIYVYDGRIYGVTERHGEYVFEYKWEAPMEDFVLSKKDYPNCVKQEKKVADVPSEDYIFCAASSLKVAFVALLAALLVALF